MLLKNTNKRWLVLGKSHREVKQMSTQKGVEAGRTECDIL